MADYLVVHTQSMVYSSTSHHQLYTSVIKKANPPPPPGATEQYPHNNRHGNNYTPMPGISWYNGPYPRNSGPFYFKVINEKNDFIKIPKKIIFPYILIENQHIHLLHFPKYTVINQNF